MSASLMHFKYDFWLEGDMVPPLNYSEKTFNLSSKTHIRFKILYKIMFIEAFAYQFYSNF